MEPTSSQNCVSDHVHLVRWELLDFWEALEWSRSSRRTDGRTVAASTAHRSRFLSVVFIHTREWVSSFHGSHPFPWMFIHLCVSGRVLPRHSFTLLDHNRFGAVFSPTWRSQGLRGGQLYDDKSLHQNIAFTVTYYF